MVFRRGRAVRSSLLFAGVSVVVVGLVAAGAPAPATADAGIRVASAVDPAPTDPPVTPAPTDPVLAPAPVDPALTAPAPSSAPTPAPEETAPTATPTPGTPTPTPLPTSLPTPDPSEPPATEPWAPVLPGLGTGPSPWVPSASAGIAAPAAFGRVYPTNPWVFNNLPGTRYLDAREATASGVARRHMGIDAQGAVRQPIFAAAAGVVTDGTWGTTRSDRHGYGNQVRIVHADGYATRYAHLADAPLVRLGDHVAAGQLIGYMGGTQRGNPNGVARHLHFEVTKDGRSIDPLAFLTGAKASAEALAAEPAPAVAAQTRGALELFEIRPTSAGGYTSIGTGVHLSSDVFTAVATGGDSAQIWVSEGGTLKRIAVVDGAWTTTDTGLALDATSLSGVDAGAGDAELFAVEDGKLFHITAAADGWTKTWTGHDFSGTVSAVRLPDGSLHAMLQQAGYLYHLSPAQGGLWNIEDTRREVGPDVDAVYVDGAAPEAMAVIDGAITRITRGELTWDVTPTGLPASGPLAAAYPGGGWPVAMSAESGAVTVSRVTNRVWAQYAYELTVPGPIDAVAVGGATILYSVG